MLTSTKSAGILFVIAALFAGCSTAPRTAEQNQTLHDETASAISNFKESDPGLQNFFANAYGYAVFPNVGEGAVGVGGAFGRGEVYTQGGKFVGHCSLTQGTVGAQLGGQNYSEVIFFQDKATLEEFTSNELTFDASASAVAASKGTSATADYRKGVLVFTRAEGGLMVQAAIGGQKFNFVSDVQSANERP